MLETILTGLAIGVFCAPFTRMIDSWMDFGGILWWIRWWRAKWYSRKDRDLRIALLEARSKEDFHERLSEVNQVYWQIAAKHFWFTGLICRECLAARFALLLTAAAILLLKIPVLSLDTFVLFIVAATVDHLTLEILDK